MRLFGQLSETRLFGFLRIYSIGPGRRFDWRTLFCDTAAISELKLSPIGKALRVLTPPGVDAPKARQSTRTSWPVSVSSIRRAFTHRARPSARSHTRRFVALRLGPYFLEPKIAERAIRDYNADPVLLAQERSAFKSIGQGFRQGAVGSQLRGLNAAYSTRSSLDDLAVIAAALEARWGRWKSLLAGIRRLDIAVPDAGRVADLLHFFLGQNTQRKPRSLATKALQFARPKAFIAVDTYTADKIGHELDAGCWADTAELGAEGMALWYGDYLTLIRKIGAENKELFTRLWHIDESTAPEAWSNRLRGLPKLLDKILWWAGREQKRGKNVKIFRP